MNVQDLMAPVWRCQSVLQIIKWHHHRVVMQFLQHTQHSLFPQKKIGNFNIKLQKFLFLHCILVPTPLFPNQENSKFSSLQICKKYYVFQRFSKIWTCIALLIFYLDPSISHFIKHKTQWSRKWSITTDFWIFHLDLAYAFI